MTKYYALYDYGYQSFRTFEKGTDEQEVIDLGYDLLYKLGMEDEIESLQESELSEHEILMDLGYEVIEISEKDYIELELHSEVNYFSLPA